MQITTHSYEETFALAEQFATKLKGGEVICLSGNLGAGKTAFSQGLAKGLGITKVINSPTFVIMKLYDAKQQTIKLLCHIDAYRLNSAKDLENIGALDYLYAPDCVTIIEWPEIVQDILTKPYQKISIAISENTRIINII
ncbi:MAG: tRNA (adenosine(37)-N6)-threonylcarbamoyltransferase complex ATPase subunit type 1 TsaE [bacterium]